MFTPKELDEMFTHHAPSADQQRRQQAVRAAAREFAQAIVENSRPGPDQSAAIRKVREAQMTANVGISLEGIL